MNEKDITRTFHGRPCKRKTVKLTEEKYVELKRKGIGEKEIAKRMGVSIGRFYKWKAETLSAEALAELRTLNARVKSGNAKAKMVRK